jgi:hypothetical protein
MGKLFSFGMCNFIVIWGFGGGGFMFAYLRMVSFCMMLHYFCVRFTFFGSVVLGCCLL